MGERSMWVLVIDDQVPNTIFMSVALRSLGHHVVVTPDPVDALTLIDQMAFDYILVDYHMPNINGATFLAALRNKLAASNRTLPVCLVTADTSGELISDAERLGAVAVLHKPISVAALREVLQRAPDPSATG